MQADQRSVQAGQRIEYIRILGTESGVQAVDYVHWPEDRQVDKQHYCELLMRAVYQLLFPLGIQELDMPALAGEGIRQLALFVDQTSPFQMSLRQTEAASSRYRLYRRHESSIEPSSK
jgi:hypothetical protein